MRPILIIVLICALMSTAFGIVCYDCESLSDPGCNEYLDTNGARQTDCNEADMPAHLQKYERRIPATGCLTKVHEGLDGSRFYIRRSCYFGDIRDRIETCNAPDPFVHWVNWISCSVCNQDLCNVNIPLLNKGQHTTTAWQKLPLVGLTLAAIALHGTHILF